MLRRELRRDREWNCREAKQPVACEPIPPAERRTSRPTRPVRSSRTRTARCRPAPQPSRSSPTNTPGQVTEQQAITPMDLHHPILREFPEHREIIRSEEHTSELQSLRHLVCRLLLEKK